LWVSNGSVVSEIGADVGGSGVPGGTNTQIQFNDSDVFGGDIGLTYNKNTDALTVAGSLFVGANVIANTSALLIGNSSVNSILTSTQLSIGATVANTTGLFAGANVFANSSAFDVGNTIITTTNLTLGGNITANGEVGMAGQALISAASGNVYWGTINTEITTVDAGIARTLTPSDAGTVIEFTNGSDIAVTIANNETQAIPVESTIYMIQGSVGQIVITPGSGVTIDYSDSLKSRTRESLIGLKQIQLNKWVLFGDTEPVAPALSVLARATNSSGRPSFLSSGGNGRFLKQNSNELVFAALSASDISAAITSGTATLVDGSVTVSSSLVTASTKIFLTVQSLGTVTTPKTVSVTSRVNNTSFTIRSEDNTDTSVVAWMMVQ
jgi:hypothetical protein